jgi:hypothetical protein
MGVEQNPAKTTAVERRIAREQQSAATRERALALRQAGQTYAAIGAELGVCLERARRVVLKAKRLSEHPRWFAALPARAVNLLARCGLDTLPDGEAAHAVARLSRKELMAQPNLGRGAIDAICAWLEQHGLALRELPRPTADRPAERDQSPTGPETDAPARKRPFADDSAITDPLAAGRTILRGRRGIYAPP